jgi:hypothetical protein
MMASYVTGLVRAALSEALATLPADAVVATATTDGFLSSVPLEKINQSGPIAKVFATTREALTGDETIWEVKHKVNRVMVMKTRGSITVDGYEGEPVIARAGYTLDDNPNDLWEECKRWLQIYEDRDYNTKRLRSSLTTLSDQWRDEADLVNVRTEVRLNLDFDMKRELIYPTDVNGLLCADTRPWQTIEAFDDARDALEAWKKSRRRILKTASDLQDLQLWTTHRQGQKASGSTSQSNRPPLVNAFLRAMARGQLQSNWKQREISEFLTQQGYPTSPDTVKQAKRRGHLMLGEVTELTEAEVAFARAVCHGAPEVLIEKLVKPNSEAEITLLSIREEAKDVENP